MTDAFDIWLDEAIRHHMRQTGKCEAVALRRCCAHRAKLGKWYTQSHVGRMGDADAVEAAIRKLDRRVRKGLTRNAQRRLHQRMMRARPA